MTESTKSCGLGLSSDRNCATAPISATDNATANKGTSRKAASVRELRAQLKAQQYRNQAEAVSVTAAGEVAPQTPSKDGCDLSFPMQRNCATDLIAEFMEVDGLSLDDATQLAQDCANVRPAHEWLSMISELDALIGQFCERFKLSDDAKARILERRNRQSLFSIAHSLEWFRTELRTAHDSSGGSVADSGTGTAQGP